MIDEKMRRLKTPSATLAMEDIFEQQRDSIEGYLASFSIVDHQAGLLAMVNGKVVGCDCFGHHKTLEKMFEKLVRSYVLDAIDWFTEKEHSFREEDAQVFLENAATARAEERPAVSLGTDVRLESEKVIGSALLHEGSLIHLTCFAKDDAPDDRAQATLYRASRRRGLL
jgi:hypothetical protein